MRHRDTLTIRCGRLCFPSLVSQHSQGNDCFNFLTNQQRFQPAIPVINNSRGFFVLCTDASIHAVQECINHDVTAIDSRFRQKPLNPLPRFTNQNPTHNRFILRRILSDQKNTGRSVQSSPMKDRSSFNTKIFDWINSGIRIILAQALERFFNITRIELMCHLCLSFADL